MAVNAVTKFIAALQSLVRQGLSKQAAEQFAKNEFGEISKFLQKRIDDVYKNPKGEGIESIKIKDEVFDDTVIKLPIDDTGQPFNPNNPLKEYGKPKKAGKGQFTKAEYLIQRLKNTIKENPDDKYVQENFPNFVKEIEANPDLAKNENVFRELGGDLPSNQKITVYDDDTLDFARLKPTKKFQLNKERFQKDFNVADDEVERIIKLSSEDQQKELQKYINKDFKERIELSDYDVTDLEPNAKGGRAGYGLGSLVKNIATSNPQILTPVQNYAMSDNSILGPAAKNAASNIMEGQARNQAALNIFNQSTPKVDARMNLDYDTLINQNEAQRNIQAQRRNPPGGINIGGRTVYENAQGRGPGTYDAFYDGSYTAVDPDMLKQASNVDPRAGIKEAFFNERLSGGERFGDAIPDFDKYGTYTGDDQLLKDYAAAGRGTPSSQLLKLPEGNPYAYGGPGYYSYDGTNFSKVGSNQYSPMTAEKELDFLRSQYIPSNLQDINQTGMPRAITQDDIDTFNFTQSDPMMTGFDYSKENNWSPGQPAPDGYRVVDMMGDQFLERMYPSKQEIAGLAGMMPPLISTSTSTLNPDAGLSGQEYAEKYGLEYAKGGRAGYYTGGMVDVEPNLSDIGHGSDALMARTRLVSPDGQATTSTGLNYLLAEDNDNIRVPFSKGKGVDLLRRGFLKTMGVAGAGIAALKTGLLGIGGKQATKEVAKEIITTPAAAGKPAWFDALVTRVVNEGEDVTKKFATKDREIVHATKVDDDAMVTVYRDLDDGTVRVDIDDATTNVMGEQGDSVVSLEVKGGQLEEGVKGKTPVEFEAREADYANYLDRGGDDYTTEVIDNVVTDTKDLTADLTKVKMYAKGQKKPTIKEMMIQRDRAKTLKLAEENPAEYASNRQPDYNPDFDIPSNRPDDFASGGIAQMIGE